MDKIKPTSGVNRAMLNVLSSLVTCYDPSGVPGSRGLWSYYYPDCDGCLFVVDGRCRERWEEVMLVFEHVAEEVLGGEIREEIEDEGAWGEQEGGERGNKERRGKGGGKIGEGGGGRGGRRGGIK